MCLLPSVVGGGSHQMCHLDTHDIFYLCHIQYPVDRDKRSQQSALFEKALHLYAQSFERVQVINIVEVDERRDIGLSVDGVGRGNESLGRSALPFQLYTINEAGFAQIVVGQFAAHFIEKYLRCNRQFPDVLFLCPTSLGQGYQQNDSE